MKKVFKHWNLNQKMLSSCRKKAIKFGQVSILVLTVINMSFLGVFFSALVGIKVASAAPSSVTLFSDSFSSTNPLDDGWTGVYLETPSTNNIDHDIYTHDLLLLAKDSYYMVVKDDAAAIRSIDTTGYEDINLSYDRRTFSMGSGDYLKVLWRVGSSGNWTTLEKVSSNSWSSKSWDLGGDAENESEIQIAFFLDDGNKDFGLIDNVVVSGNQSVVCGNDIQEDGEECDGQDGEFGEHQECDENCEIIDLTYCGDDIFQALNDENVVEECDNGEANYDDMEPVYSFNQGDGDRTYCSTLCEIYEVEGTYCGDGIQNGDEECDGVDGVGDHQECNESCEITNLTYCGNGSVEELNDEQTGGPLDDGAEDCDDGENGSDVCTASCVEITPDGYCGDGEVNQTWEQCEGGEGCTDMCLWEEQEECNDIILARVNVVAYNNVVNGDVSDTTYLGSEYNALPEGTWFALYYNGSFINDADILNYEDVPGLAIQRLDGELRLVNHTTLSSRDLEEVWGNVEFYNATINNQYEDNYNPLEESGVKPEYIDVITNNGNYSGFEFHANTGDDGYYMEYSQNDECLPYCGDGIENNEEECDSGVKGSQNCSKTCQIIEFCGDGEVNQNWEQCDGKRGCSEMCLWDEQEECSDLVLAKINIENVNNDGIGDMTDDIYLGTSNENIPNNTWFALYENGNYVVDTDMEIDPQYEDVPGLAVQRLGGSLRTVLHGSMAKPKKGKNKETVSGTIEFYNASADSVYEDTSKIYPKKNKIEKNDTISVTSTTTAMFDLKVTTADDGFYTDWTIKDDCEKPVNYGSITVCKYDDSENPLSDWEINVSTEELVKNGSFELPEVEYKSGWQLFEEGGDLEWSVDWAGDYSGNPLIEIQENYYTPADGDQYIELDSTNQTIVSQEIETNPGSEYLLTFSYSPRPGISLSENEINVTFGDLNEDIASTTSGDTDWKVYSYVVTADSEETLLSFEALGTNNSLGGLIDNVSIKQKVDSQYTSEEDGCTTFTDLLLGTYTITETIQEDWTQLAPKEGYYTVELDEENLNSSIDFINQYNEEEKTYSVHGKKWNDVNGNGEFDGCLTDKGFQYENLQVLQCEEYLPDWEIYIEDSEGKFIASTTTSSSTEHYGWYWFEDLEAGDYRICEVNQDGWQQTYPVESNCHEVTLPDDGNQERTLNAVYAPEYNFGNHYIGNQEICGDETCSEGENCETCPADCGICDQDEYCGDSSCNNDETCSTCEIDCGSCGSSVRSSGGGGGLPTTLQSSNPQIEMYCEGSSVTVNFTWLTNMTATSRVVYDVLPHMNAKDLGAPNYGYAFSSSEDIDKVTGHSVVITGLNPDTVYYFRPISNASSEEVGDEKELTQTLACGGSEDEGIIVLGEEGAPNLEINKTVSTDFANKGQEGIEYRVTVKNSGNLDAFSVILTDVLPEGLSYSSGDSNTRTWELGDIAPQDEKEISYLVNVSKDAEYKVYTNTASVSAANHDFVSASADLEIKDILVLAETGFSIMEFMAIVTLLFSSLGAVMYLRKKTETSA